MHDIPHRFDAEQSLLQPTTPLCISSVKHIFFGAHRKYRLIPDREEAFSQTVANDDGLWDFQDGKTREVSR